MDTIAALIDTHVKFIWLNCIMVMALPVMKFKDQGYKIRKIFV